MLGCAEAASPETASGRDRSQDAVSRQSEAYRHNRLAADHRQRCASRSVPGLEDAVMRKSEPHPILARAPGLLCVVFDSSIPQR